MTVRLRSLGGAEAPPSLTLDFAVFALFDEPARRALGRVVLAAIPEPLTEAADQALDAFVDAYGVDRDALGRILKASRFLLREAAKRDLSLDELSSDAGEVAGTPRELAEMLIGIYEDARQRVRREIVMDAMGDHGSVLVGVDWRLDALDRTSHGNAGGASVAWLTLRYQDGAREARLSVQATPDVLHELRRACEELTRSTT